MAWKPPKTQSARRRQAATWGASRCFLVVKRVKNKRGGGSRLELHYPICGPGGRISCDGLRYAYARAKQQGNRRVASLALQEACRQCNWVANNPRKPFETICR